MAAVKPERGTEYDYEGITMMKEVFPAEVLDKIKETEFDDEDIIVATYAKCGTTWMQEIVYLVATEGDFAESDRTPLHHRYYFMEMVRNGVSFFEKGMEASPPRFWKTHLYSYFLKKTLDNKKTKIVAVMRNPKDMLASFYNFYKMTGFDFDVDGTWEEFFDRFKKDKLVHGNYFDMQLSWWAYKDDPRVLICKFEDMIKDLEKVVRQVAAHFGKNLSDEVIQKIVERTTFKNMKDNKMLNYSTNDGMNHSVSPFMRKGQIGDWKNYFTEEQRRYVDNLSKLKFETKGLFLEDE